MRKPNWHFFLLTALVVLVSGCQTWVPRPPIASKTVYGPDAAASPGKIQQPQESPQKGVAQSELSHFLYLDNKARQDGAQTEDLFKYLESGIALSDRLCADWFTALEDSRQTSEFRQGTFSISGTTTGALLGLFKAAPEEIGAVAALFGGIDSWFNMGKATFFLTPKIGTLQEKLSSLRREMSDEAVGNARTWASYQAAYRFLIDYGKTCTALELQRFVDSATELAKYEWKPRGEIDVQTAIQLDLLSSQLATSIKWRSLKLGQGELRELYILVFHSDVAATLKLPTPVGQILKKAYDESGERKEEATKTLAAIGTLLELEKEIERVAPGVSEVESLVQSNGSQPAIEGARQRIRQRLLTSPGGPGESRVVPNR
jgi:hypothetical protein